MPAPRALTIDLKGQPVKVYRNLKNGLFSVQFGGPLWGNGQRRQAAHLMWQQEELTKYGRVITSWDEAPATPAEAAPVESQSAPF